MSVSTPLLFSSSGPVPTPPSTLLAALLAYVAGQAPGYTANLPGSLVEDVSSTDLGALIVIDQARVDAVNNVSPYSANAFVLNQQGVMLGLPSGLSSNANALVVFSGTPGYVIPPGFQCGDGTYTYNVQDGGTIGNSGQSQSLYVVCTSSNVFPIPANSITTIITSVPSPYSLTVTNPVAGNAATGAETTQAYRSRIMTAFNGIIQGVNSQIKTLVMAVPGVSSRLVAVRQNGIYWTVVCGGGDPFQVAGAIYAGCSQIGLLTGSSISSARNVTVSIYDAPDNYTVVFVNPPQQVVTVGVTWNTTLA